MKPEPDRTTAEASAWVLRHDRGLTAAEAETFARWRKDDPRNAIAFAELTSQWRRMDRLGAIPLLTAMANAAEATARARQVRRRRWRAAAAGFAAAAAAVAAFFLGPYHPAQPAGSGPAPSYVIVPATERTLTLADQSVAQLNGRSTLIPEFAPAERRVKLVGGEAHFHVTKNPARPFVVVAGPITVNAVGTAFDVRLEADSVDVLVTEGRVALRSPDQTPLARILLPGDHAVVRTTAANQLSVGLDRPGSAEIERRLAWESTRLVFDRTSLAQVVEAFNRFNDRQLVLGEPELGQRTLTGTFRADNLTGFMHLLRASVDVQAEGGDMGPIVLRAAGR